ncbi:MAG TPA: DUF2252 domain-containing protein [Anaeromyxobacteraceae bacterium]
MSEAPPRPSVRERKAMGKALRNRLPRKDHAAWTVVPRRVDLVHQLKAAVAGRRADLLPIRWGRMVASPFGFYRGAAALMASDIGPLPTSGLEVQVCGDAHLLNLGAYAAPDGHLVFDLNDFDETCRGPFEWDVRRLAASFAVAGRTAGHGDGACAGAVRAMVQAYRDGLDRFSELPVLDLVRYEITPRSTRKPLAPIFRQAARHTPQQLLEKATAPGPKGFAHFLSKPPLLTPLEAAEAGALRRSLAAYRSTLGMGRQQALDAYTPWDFAFKVVGTGSVGVDAYLVLLYGNGARDPLFLQIKEEDPTCWRPHLKSAGDYFAAYPHQGRRTAEGQLRTQTVADPFLGWTRFGGTDFVVRQWSDHKASVDVSMLSDGTIQDYAALCGEVLAKAHARTGDPAMLAGYCGASDRLDRAVGTFALAYADQTEADHALLRKAIKDGKLEAREGV